MYWSRFVFELLFEIFVHSIYIFLVLWLLSFEAQIYFSQHSLLNLDFSAAQTSSGMFNNVVKSSWWQRILLWSLTLHSWCRYIFLLGFAFESKYFYHSWNSCMCQVFKNCVTIEKILKIENTNLVYGVHIYTYSYFLYFWLWQVDLKVPVLQNHIKACPNLSRYVSKTIQRFFPSGKDWNI